MNPKHLVCQTMREAQIGKNKASATYVQVQLRAARPRIREANRGQIRLPLEPSFNPATPKPLLGRVRTAHSTGKRRYSVLVQLRME